MPQRPTSKSPNKGHLNLGASGRNKAKNLSHTTACSAAARLFKTMVNSVSERVVEKRFSKNYVGLICPTPSNSKPAFLGGINYCYGFLGTTGIATTDGGGRQND
jgi:hypothetical protein